MLRRMTANDMLFELEAARKKQRKQRRQKRRVEKVDIEEILAEVTKDKSSGWMEWGAFPRLRRQSPHGHHHHILRFCYPRTTTTLSLLRLAATLARGARGHKSSIVMEFYTLVAIWKGALGGALEVPRALGQHGYGDLYTRLHLASSILSPKNINNTKDTA